MTAAIHNFAFSPEPGRSQLPICEISRSGNYKGTDSSKPGLGVPGLDDQGVLRVSELRSFNLSLVSIANNYASARAQLPTSALCSHRSQSTQCAR